MKKTRLEYNRMILEKLKEYLENNPNIRFGQALCNLNIIKYSLDNDSYNNKVIDPFFEESSETYKELYTYY